jgi:hypothetical protein
LSWFDDICLFLLQSKGELYHITIKPQSKLAMSNGEAIAMILTLAVLALLAGAVFT